MSKGIWVTPDKFIDFADTPDRQALTEEIASRATAWDFSGLLGLLPDPDPVLLKRGDGPEVLNSLLSDGHLTSVVQTRKLGSLKREFKWEAGSLGGKEAIPQAEKLRGHLVEDLERVDLYNLISTILDAPLYGFTPIEIKWETGKGRVRIKDLEDKPNRWFGFDEHNKPRFISANNQWEGEDIPFGKFVFARHFPTYDNPYGLRLLSRCFWPITFKRGGIKFWVTFAEKYGMPFLFGRYPRGAPPTEQNDLLASLASMIQDAVAIGPEGSTVELLGAGSNSKGSADLYSQLKSAMDSEVSKVIQGQTLTAEVSDKGGAYAQSKTHEGVLADYREADQKLVKKVMGEIAHIYALVNAPGVPAPVFKWFEDEDAQKDFADRDKTLSETGVKFTKTYYERRYNLKEDEFDLAETTPNATEAAGVAKQAEGDFAEHFKGHKGGNFTPEQQALEDLADQAVDQAARALAGNEDFFVKIVQESESYEEAMLKLAEAWPDLDMDGLAGALESALLNTGLYGRYTVQVKADDA